jgi:hypothetical protein
MNAPKHGRRAAKIANEEGFEPVPLPHSNDTVFKLEVRVNQDTKSLKLLPQLLSNEYSTRYLEKIGVRPTKTTIEMVNKNVPLSESCIKTTLRVSTNSLPSEMHGFLWRAVLAFKSYLLLN